MPTTPINQINYYYELHGSGMGQTSINNQLLSIEQMADDTMDLTKALGLEKPIILGQSTGGLIAQMMAKKYAGNIKKLILLNTTTKVSTKVIMVLNSFLTMLKQNVAFDTVIESSMPWFYSSLYLSDPNKIAAYKKGLMANPYPPSIEILERQLKALSAFDSSAWINTITLPTQVILSTEDIICSPAECQALSKQLSGVKVENLPGGHSSAMECPDKLSEVLIQYL